MFMKWRRPEAAFPSSGLDVSNRERVMGWEMPLHPMGKAAAFLPLEIFEKGLKPPLWNSVWHMLFVADFFSFHVGSHDCTNFFFGHFKNSAPQGVWGGEGRPPPLDPSPKGTPTPLVWAHLRTIPQGINLVVCNPF